MDKETIILILLVLILGTVIGFTFSGGYEQQKTQMQVCHQISDTIAQYDNCINLDYDKFIISFKKRK